MGDRDAERVSKQCRDGKPVGQCPNHGGLCSGLDEAQPWEFALKNSSGNKYTGHKSEKARGQAFHFDQFPGFMKVRC